MICLVVLHQLIKAALTTTAQYAMERNIRMSDRKPRTHKRVVTEQERRSLPMGGSSSVQACAYLLEKTIFLLWDYAVSRAFSTSNGSWRKTKWLV